MGASHGEVGPGGAAAPGGRLWARDAGADRRALTLVEANHIETGVGFHVREERGVSRLARVFDRVGTPTVSNGEEPEDHVIQDSPLTSCPTLPPTSAGVEAVVEVGEARRGTPRGRRRATPPR